MQLSTIQFDFTLPERFEMVFVGEDGQEHRPYMIHRRCWDRWNGSWVAHRHFAGAFPVWLAPVQAMLIRSRPACGYARQVAQELKQAGIRVEVDDRGERMNAKIRDAQNQKIPYMLVVGDREAEQGRWRCACALKRILERCPSQLSWRGQSGYRSWLLN